MGDHHQGGIGDCPSTSSPTRVTLGTSAREGCGGVCQQLCRQARHGHQLPTEAPHRSRNRTSNRSGSRRRSGTTRGSQCWGSAAFPPPHRVLLPSLACICKISLLLLITFKLFEVRTALPYYPWHWNSHYQNYVVYYSFSPLRVYMFYFY